MATSMLASGNHREISTRDRCEHARPLHERICVFIKAAQQLHRSCIKAATWLQQSTGAMHTLLTRVPVACVPAGFFSAGLGNGLGFGVGTAASFFVPARALCAPGARAFWPGAALPRTLLPPALRRGHGANHDMKGETCREHERTRMSPGSLLCAQFCPATHC
eukprot:301522-Chlamydomonas_euryale.AAC.7